MRALTWISCALESSCGQQAAGFPQRDPKAKSGIQDGLWPSGAAAAPREDPQEQATKGGKTPQKKATKGGKQTRRRQHKT